MKSVFVLVLGLVVLVSTAPVSMAADAAAGKAIYSKKCANCHGPSGEGKESVAKMLKIELKHLGAKEVQAKSDAELQRIILKGDGKMKVVAGIDAKGADDVIAYVRTLAKK